MAKEYIEREKTIKDLEKLCVDGKMIGDDNSTYIDFADVIDVVTEQPTADVQEVRHGNNVTTNDPIIEFECSECGFVCEISENLNDYADIIDLQKYYSPNFCPHCGAKMDKESEQE